MIKLTAKVGLIVEFSMSDEIKEKTLVDKFILGSVKPSANLKLGKFGNIHVKDIADMKYINTQPTKEAKDIKVDDIMPGFSDMFKNNPFGF